MPTPPSQKIAEAIRQQVSTALGAQIPPGFVVIRDPAGFPYAIQYGASAYWNPGTLAMIDQLCAAPGDGTARLTGTGFSATYADILGHTNYVTSTADAASQQDRLTRFNAATQTLIAQFETDFGPITPAQIAALHSMPPTKAQYVADYVAAHFKGDPPDFPLSMSAFASAWSDWATLGADIARDTAARAEANALLAAGQAHVRHPSAANGGLQTDATTWVPAYVGLPDNNTVAGELQDDARAITVSLTLDKAGQRLFALSVARQPLSDVPPGALMLMVTPQPATEAEDLAPLWDAATRVEMDIAYVGLCLITAQPLDLSVDAATGWFSRAALGQIAGKTGKDVTGLQLSGSAYSVADLFGPGKTLARIATFVLSREPTITLRFHGIPAQQMLAKATPGARARVTIPQLGTFGAADAGFAIESADAAGGVVTVVIAPATPPGTIPPEQRTAHVIGGIPDFPP